MNMPRRVGAIVAGVALALAPVACGDDDPDIVIPAESASPTDGLESPSSSASPSASPTDDADDGDGDNSGPGGGGEGGDEGEGSGR
jgi:hypothetical protein